MIALVDAGIEVKSRLTLVLLHLKLDFIQTFTLD